MVTFVAICFVLRSAAQSCKIDRSAIFSKILTLYFVDFVAVTPKTQTLQTADRAHSQTVQAVKTEYFFFLLFVEILISRNMNVNKQDRVLFLVL